MSLGEKQGEGRPAWERSRWSRGNLELEIYHRSKQQQTGAEGRAHGSWQMGVEGLTEAPPSAFQPLPRQSPTNPLSGGLRGTGHWSPLRFAASAGYRKGVRPGRGASLSKQVGPGQGAEGLLQGHFPTRQ